MPAPAVPLIGMGIIAVATIILADGARKAAIDAGEGLGKGMRDASIILAIGGSGAFLIRAVRKKK